MRTWPDAEGLHTVGPDVSIFPENCAVARVAFTVKDKPYLIYLIHFDCERSGQCYLCFSSLGAFGIVHAEGITG